MSQSLVQGQETTITSSQVVEGGIVDPGTELTFTIETPISTFSHNFNSGSLTATGISDITFTSDDFPFILSPSTTHTFKLIPPAGESTGTVTITLSANTFQKFNPDFNSSEVTFTFTYGVFVPDTTAPTFTAKTISTTEIKLTFSEDISGSTAVGNWDIVGDNTVTAVSSETLSDATTLTLTVGTSFATDATPTVVYTKPSSGDSIRDGADNALSTASVTSTDGAAPTVAISSTATSPTSLVEIPIKILFSESVTGLTQSEITVGGGSITSNSFAGSGATYTFTVSPTNNGQITVDLPANVAVDGEQNDNTAATQFSITSDRMAPSLSNIRFTGTNTIEMEVSEDIVNPSSSVFTISPNIGINNVSYADNKIILTTGSSGSIGTSYVITHLDIRDLVNPANVLSGTQLSSIRYTAPDIIAPTFTAKTISTTQIELTFSEDVSGLTATSHWAIGDNTVTAVSPTTLSNIRTLTLTVDTAFATDATPTVRYIPPASGSIRDGANNVLSNAVVTSTDGVAPILSDARFISANTVTIAVSEDILEPSGIGLVFSIPGLTNDNVSYSTEDDLITITTSTDAEIGTSYDIVYSDISDLAAPANTLRSGTLIGIVYTAIDINEAPTISDETLTLAENVADETSVGSITTGIDPDAGDTLSYSITSGNTNDAFAIDPISGEITVNGNNEPS